MVNLLKLRCTRGTLSGEVFELDPAYRYILGREPQAEAEDVQLIELPSRTVSRNHAELHFDGSAWVIQDLNSYNGIRVNKTKVFEAYLSCGSVIEIGEFSFYCDSAELDQTNVESEESVQRNIQTSTSQNNLQLRLIEKLKELKGKFDKIDFVHRMLILLATLSLISYFILRFPVLIQIQKNLLDQTYSYAAQVTMNLGEKNKRELADRSFYLLDCDYLRGSSVVRSASLWDRQGKMVCPIGESREPDYLLKLAMERQELVSDCDSSVSVDKLQTCSLVIPVKVWPEESSSMSSVGYARVDYFASDVKADVEALRSLFWKLLFVILLLTGVVWWLLKNWLRNATNELVQDVHLLSTGTVQKVEQRESFAALNELVNEINRVFSKLNQEVKPDSELDKTEASFLQTILQQVFLLEERAVLAVDSENHVIAMTSLVTELAPIHEEAVGLHISEAIADTHLQGELMSLLNDISTSDEVLDRPLSTSDRVIQAQAMPIYLRDEFVASLILF